MDKIFLLQILADLDVLISAVRTVLKVSISFDFSRDVHYCRISAPIHAETRTGLLVGLQSVTGIKNPTR